MQFKLIRLLELAALAVALPLQGCNGGSDRGGVAAVHQDVLLRDRLGSVLSVDSSEPYSPRQTCGPCHDVDAIANAYHFQQGRTNAQGDMIVAADYYQDGRTYILSPGMYGKW